MILSLVARRAGVGFVPDYWVANSEIALSTFKTRSVSMTQDVVLAWPEQRRDDKLLNVFVQFVTSRHWKPNRRGTGDRSQVSRV